ncbi:hypothetical protein RIF29_28732 [Crotalaria pallida]|uniref:Uncharacterized protein n=1 Tax=Crotalaria pallida TaxID=3830 RepID=A0AAN9HWT1_CROPI
MSVLSDLINLDISSTDKIMAEYIWLSETIYHSPDLYTTKAGSSRGRVFAFLLLTTLKISQILLRGFQWIQPLGFQIPNPIPFPFPYLILQFSYPCAFQLRVFRSQNS